MGMCVVYKIVYTRVQISPIAVCKRDPFCLQLIASKMQIL